MIVMSNYCSTADDCVALTVRIVTQRRSVDFEYSHQ
jgi:hypothetical protein